MPKLNNEYFIKILQKLQENENDKEKSLERFMLAGKECAEFGKNSFRKLKISKVLISKNRWQLFEINPKYIPNGDYYPYRQYDYYKLKFNFGNFLFIKTISSVLPISTIDILELISPNPNCYAFLKGFERLNFLGIECKSEEEYRNMFTSLSNVKAVRILNLIGIDSEFIDSLHFDYVYLNLFDFIFEKKLNFGLPKQDVKRVALYGNEKTKKAFVFEPEHFINYFKAFPSAEFRFDIHHTITDANTDCLNFLYGNNYLQKISEAIKTHAHISVIYYNYESILKSTLWKRLQLLGKKEMCLACPIDTRSTKGGDAKVDFDITYEFPKRNTFELFAEKI